MAHPNRIFRGKVGNGRLWLELRDDFKRLIDKLEGEDIEIILRKMRRKRSLPQNAYLWGVVYPLLADHLGYDEEELHEACKLRFLRDHKNEVEGFVRVRSTTSLDTAEMTEYIERVRRLAADLGVVIPDPGVTA